MADKIQFKELISKDKWENSSKGKIQSKVENLKTQYDIIFSTTTEDEFEQDTYFVKINLTMKTESGATRPIYAYIPGVPYSQSKYMTYKFEFPKDKDKDNRLFLYEWSVEMTGGQFNLSETSLKLDLETSPGDTAPPSENIVDSANVATATPPYKRLPNLMGNSFYLSFMPLMYTGTNFETMITTDGEDSFTPLDSGVITNRFVSRIYNWDSSSNSFVFEKGISEDFLVQFSNTCQYETNSEKLYKAITTSGYKCVYSNEHLPHSQDNTFYTWWYSLPSDLSNYQHWCVYSNLDSINRDYVMYIIAGDTITQSELIDRYKYACKINVTGSVNTSRVWEYRQLQGQFEDKGVVNMEEGKIIPNGYSVYCNSIMLRDILKMGNIDSVLLRR